MAVNGAEASRVPRARRRPLASYLLDVTPYALTTVLGAWLLLPLHWLLALAELLAGVVGPLVMMVTLCPKCTLYGSPLCPSGFGLASARLAARGDAATFRASFRYQILSVVPMWAIPLAGLAYMPIAGVEVPWVPTVAFLVVAFAVVPLKARYVTCPRCAKRADCPWGSRTSKHRHIPPRVG